jgi:3-methyladenine DNA glycosylase/8-oxoguanine DNA glycosylase
VARVELELVGAGGEPVDFWRTVNSHGLNDLVPNRIDSNERTLELTLYPGPQTVLVRKAGPTSGIVEGRAPRRVAGAVRHVLRLDEDLSPLYAQLAKDPALSWASRGAGRWMRSQTAFEDVIKTVCTTNCAWSGTMRMVGALVQRLGEESDTGGRAFPTPERMAAKPERWYRDVARAGYRAAYLRALARSVGSGELPGVGPYAAAHIMMLVGRYSRLVLDSWTRPTYARLNGRKAADVTIERRFRRYGPYAGLAFWLFLTRDWVED